MMEKNLMVTPTPETNANANAISMDDMLKALANADRSQMTEEQGIVYDRLIVASSNSMDSDRRSNANAAEKAELLRELQVVAAKAGLFKAAEKFFLLTGNNVWLRLNIVREKTSSGEWKYELGSLPSSTKGEDFIPGGKDLKFKYGSETFLNTWDSIKNVQVDKPRGARHATLALCKHINLAVGKPETNANGEPIDNKSSSPSTSIKRQLELTDGDGNPAGKSFHRTKLEQVQIQHPSINDGKWMKLTDYYLDWMSPEEEDEAEAESEE